MLSETLLIMFRNFFHPDRAVFPLLVQPIRISHIADFLSGGGGAPSAFERFGIREANGSFCRITSHQFRHWLNYIADKGDFRSICRRDGWAANIHEIRRRIVMPLSTRGSNG